MPRRDGTGPQGKGAKTGRGLGNCDRNSGSKKPNSTQNKDNKEKKK